MNTRVLGVLAILFLLVLGAWRMYSMGYSEGQSDERAEWVALQKKQLKAHTEALEAARKAEQTLRNQADTLKRESSDEIARLNANVDVLLGRLRDRPQRPPAPQTGGLPTTPSTPTTGPGCDGTKLYKPDAEFLVRESARADKAVIALKECRAQYEAAQTALQPVTSMAQ